MLVFRVALEIVETKRNNLTSSNTLGVSLLEQYLSMSEIDYKDVTGMAVDMLLAGIDTVSRCTAYKNPAYFQIHEL